MKRRIPPPLNAKAYIAHLLNLSGKNQAQLAAHLGVRPNVVSMILRGRLKLPAARVSEIAGYLAGDRNYLMMLVIAEQFPALHWFVADATIGGTSISDEERQAVIELRRISGMDGR